MSNFLKLFKLHTRICSFFMYGEHHIQECLTFFWKRKPPGLTVSQYLLFSSPNADARDYFFAIVVGVSAKKKCIYANGEKKGPQVRMSQFTMGSYAAPSNVLFLLGMTSLTVKIFAESCTLCADGSPPNLNGVLIDGTSCNDIKIAADEKLPSPDEECVMLQALGFQFCDCPTPPPLPEDACTICPDGAMISDPDIEVIGLNTTCGSAEIITNIFLGPSAACDFLPLFEYYCGCSEVQPSCTACPNGSTVSNPNVLIPNVDVSCGFADLVASLSPNHTICEEYQQEFMYAANGDICGCVKSFSQPTELPSSTISPSVKSIITPTTSPTVSPVTPEPTPNPSKYASSKPTAAPVEPLNTNPTSHPTISPSKTLTVPEEPTSSPFEPNDIPVTRTSNDVSPDTPSTSPTDMPTATLSGEPTAAIVEPSSTGSFRSIGATLIFIELATCIVPLLYM